MDANTTASQNPAKEATPSGKTTRIEIHGLTWHTVAIADRFVTSVIGAHRPTPAQGANIIISQKRYHATVTVLFAPRKQSRKLIVFFKKIRTEENPFRHWLAVKMTFSAGDAPSREYRVVEYLKGHMVFVQPSQGPGSITKAFLA